MPYKLTPGQRKYLRRKFADDKEMETCCDCPGGAACPIPADTDGKYNPCKGFVRNCTCDTDLSFLHERQQAVTPLQSEGPGF